MSLSMDRSTESRLQKDLNILQNKQTAELRKVAQATKSQNAAMSAASRASSSSLASSKMAQAERDGKTIERAQDQAARHGEEMGRKRDELVRVQTRIRDGEAKERNDQAKALEKQRKADDKARKQLKDDNRKLAKDIDGLKKQLTAAIEAQAAQTQPFIVESGEGRDRPYDFFISHASADKKDFVDGLVEQAKAADLDVWYDNNALAWGDSIRQKIDDGLRRSYFGVVVLSPSFFDRPWTEYELDAIIQRDLSGHGRLLPIWHRLSRDDVERHAPALAGRLAIPTANYSTSQIVDELLVMRDRFKAAGGGDV